MTYAEEPNRIAALPRMRSGPQRGANQTRCMRGQAYLEFAIVAPLLLTLIFGILVFGIAFDHYEALTFATNSGAQLLSISRGQTTDPCQTASQAVYSAAPQLKQSNLKFSIVLGGNTIANNSSNPTCGGSQQYLVQSQNAQVTVTYPCNLAIFGMNPAPNCTLAAQTTVAIQ